MHAHFGGLGHEVTACVTILAGKTRRPPACGPRLHTGREAPKSSRGEMRDGPPADRSLRGQAARHRGKMIDEPPVECFHTGRSAHQSGNKGQITIPILGIGSRTPNPEPKEKKKKKRRVAVKTARNHMVIRT